MADQFNILDKTDLTVDSITMNLGGIVLIDPGTEGAPGLAIVGDTDTGLFSSTNGQLDLTINGAANLELSANLLEQVNGPNAQAYNLYNTKTDASNFERFEIKYAGDIITFASESAGTGTTRFVTFTGANVGVGVFPAALLHVNGTSIISSTLALGSTTQDASALLDMTSTTKGFLLPRMTTTQRDNISSPATGLTIYNTTTNVLNFFNGTIWGAI